MAAMPGRFEVEDGEIIDTQARQIISLDQLAKVATPEEQASVRQQIQDSGWAGADQTEGTDSPMTARGTVTRPGATETPSQQESLPARPSLQQFMTVAKEDNPDVPDRDLRRYWAQNYSDIDPKTLPSLETFMTAAKEDNPGVPEQALKAYWEENYGDFGAAEKEAGDFGRGISTAFKQIPQLGYGVAAGIGAAGESMLGEGGISTKLKEWGVAGYLEKSKQIYDQSKPSDDFTYSWDQAKQGNFGALVDWMQYGLGYMGAQGAQMLATAGAGSLAGRLAQGPVSTMAAGLVAKEAARIKATQAGSALAAEELGKLATANVASRIGQTTALAAAATGMEGGEIFGDLSAESAKSGQALSGEQLAKAFGATLAAGGLEFVGDKLGLDLMLGKTLAGKIGGRAARVGAGAAAGSAVEGGTEVGQTLIEEYGKGHDPFSPESMREAVNAGALGAFGGTVLGGAGGIVNRTEEPPAAVPIESIPDQIGVGNPSVSIDQAIKNATGLLSAPVSSTRAQEDALSTRLAQLSATTSAQREADRIESERQLRAGERLPTAQEAALQSDTVPRTGQDIPILEGAQSAPSTLPIAEPSRLWMDEAVVPGIEPGQAFTPRASVEPDAKARIADERAKLVAMQQRSRQASDIEPTPMSETPPQSDIPLQSAADLAYPPSERGRMLTQAELALRDRMASKRPAQQVPLIEGAQPSKASTIVPGSTFAPRQESEPTAKERIAAEREKLVRMKATRPAPKTSEPTVPPSSPYSDAPLRTALDRAYPSVAELHDLAREKGFDVESDVFKTLTKMSTGKSHLDELSPGARDRFAETLRKLTPAKTPEIIESPTKKALAPVQPTAPSSDAVTAPRSVLPPEKNAEMLLRAEKASADLGSSSEMQDESLIDFLKSKGGLQDQGGELSTMEVDAQRKAFSKKLIQEKGLTLDQAAELAHEAGHIPERDIALLLDGIDKEVRGKGQHADWYRELTTGPKPMTRQAIDTAVAKIIEDHGVDTGAAVERVKAALLNDREFDGTQWGEDAAAIARGDWPAWIEKPDAPSQSGPVRTSEPVSASPPTEGTTTTAPQTEAATTIDSKAHEAAPSPSNDRPEPSEAQIEAGNFRKGHLKISGLDISIENPQGSTRSGTDKDGKPWSIVMQHHYGYFRGADFKGKDKEHIDVFVKPGTPEDYSGPVFVIDQKDPNTGRFDEHKAVIGASSSDDARAIYHANYAKDWKGFRSIKSFTMPQFKLWLKAGNKQKPVGMARPEKQSADTSFALTAQEVKPENQKSESKQTSIDIPPEAVGSRPIIGREVTPEEAPLFSKAAQEPEEKQTDLTDGLTAFDNQAPYEQRPNEPAARNRALAREALAAIDGAASVHDQRGDISGPRSPRSARPEEERLAGLERAGIRTPAVAISKDLAEKGRVDLRGYTVTSMADLAVIAQVFRNPRVETMRFFYVKDGKIVGHEGITSRMPGAAAAFPISRGDLEGMTVGERVERQESLGKDLLDRMDRLGADGYYMLHNHPSGVSRPSRADIQLTRLFDQAIPGLLGHVVIDSNEYSTIEASGNVATHQLPAQKDAILEPYRPHTLLGPIIKDPESLATVGKAMQTTEGYITIVYVSGGDGKTRAIQEIPQGLFLNVSEATNFLRGQARAFGAMDALAYADTNDTAVWRAARELQKTGSLLDFAGTLNGKPESLSRHDQYKDDKQSFGVPHRLIGGMRVSDNEPGMDYARNSPDSKPSGKKPNGLLNNAQRNATDDIGLTYDDLNSPNSPGITTTPDPSSNVPSRSRVTRDLSDAQRAALARVHGTKETWAERMDSFKKTWKRELVQGLFDQYAPILDYSKKGYILSRMAKSGDGTLEALMLYGKPYVDSDGAYRVDYSESSGMQGFSKVLSSLQGEHDRFLEWVAAQRAGRLKSVGLENLYSEADIATLKTLNQGTMPDGSSREAAYLRALSQLNEWNDAMVKIGVDSGLISEEAREQFKNVPYVPFYRLQEEGLVTGFGKKPGLVNQYAWKKLKGGTAHLNDDLLANLLQNWSHIITASAKNRAAKETLTAAKLAGVAEEIPSGAPGKGHVHYLENGKEVTFTVSDPALMDAVAALHYAGLGSIGKPFTAMKRALSFAVTVNPAYKIRNLIRDSIQAIGTSDLSYNPLKNMRQGAKATRHDSETRAQLLAGGGMMRFGSMLDGNDTTRTRRIIESGVDPGTILSDAGAIEKVWKRLIQPAFQAYQEFGDRGEQLNRAALYEQLLKKGLSHQEASFWARDLMDFSMSGKWAGVRILTQIVPFMNARLQGLYKLGRATKQDYRKLATTLGAVALASIGLMLAYQDDEDWKKREDFDRENYWWFKVGNTAFRLPKPFEIGVVGTIAERSVEYLVSREMTGERFGERLAAVVFSQLSMNPTPQLVKPLMDLYANKDAFTGRPIETMGMERLRKEDRYTDRTSETAKFLGSLGLPDPAQLAMGRWNTLSPVQVDSLVRGYFSWLGSTTMTALDYGIRPMLNRGERPDMTLKEAFLVGNFAESLPNNSSRYMTQFYAQATEIEQAYNSYRDALKRGDTEQAASIMEEEHDKIGQYRMVEHVKKQESVLNQQIKLIERSQRMSGEEKRARLDELQQRKQRLVERVAERQMVAQ